MNASTDITRDHFAMRYI